MATKTKGNGVGASNLPLKIDWRKSCRNKIDNLFEAMHWYCFLSDCSVLFSGKGYGSLSAKDTQIKKNATHHGVSPDNVKIREGYYRLQCVSRIGELGKFLGRELSAKQVIKVLQERRKRDGDLFQVKKQIKSLIDTRDQDDATDGIAELLLLKE